MPKINSLEVVHQDTNKDSYQNLHDILVALNKSLALEKEVVDGDARASIENLLEMYVNDKEAFLRSVRTLTAQFKTSEAKYSEEISLLANALAAEAKRTSTLSAKTENQFASVTEYAEAVASEVARKTATYSQDTAPTANLSYGDIWIDTNDNNRMYSWNGLVWSEVTKPPTFRQATQPASATTGDVWMDTDDNNKMWRYDGSTWVATDDLRIAKTYARWGVQVDVNGRVAGIQLNADDLGSSEFIVLADAFKVYNTSTGIDDAIFTVRDGVVTPKNLRVNDTSGNWLLKVSDNDAGALLWKPSLSMGTSSNLGLPSSPSFAAYGVSTSNTHILYAEATGSNSNNHAFRGSNGYYGTSGVVGVGGSYDFYAEGSGTNYGPFTGAHDALMSINNSIEIGDIVVDAEVLIKRNVSSTLFKVGYSTSANQKGVLGVIAASTGTLKDAFKPASFEFNIDEEGVEHSPYIDIYNQYKDTANVIAVNAIGEGQINVCGENGDIAVGDLIVSSSIPGKGMKQYDDILRSYTVAKAREAVTFSSPTEVKQVACIYLCG